MTVATAALQAFLVGAVLLLVWFEVVEWLRERADQRHKNAAQVLRLSELQPDMLRREK